MKRLHYLLAGWALMACLASCKHDPNPEPAVDPPGGQPPLTTEVGQPAGEATSKLIGPQGGSLTSADGTLELTLPAGALAQATTITIQPITNQAPHGLGLAYRFLPDGTQFARPATLTWHYKASAVAANDPDLLRVAFQGSDQTWYQVPGVEVDTATHQMSLPMPHFSDWSAYEVAEIEQLNLDGGPNLGAYLDFGASTSLAVTYARLAPLVPGSTDKPLEIKAITWSLPGGSANGQLRGTGDRAVYTAPSGYPPQNPVTVVAEVSFTNSERKVLLLKRILVGPDYFTGTFGGTPFAWVNHYYYKTDKTIHLSGWNESESQSLNLLMVARNVNRPQGSYSYVAGGPKNSGQAFAEFAQAYDGKSGFLTYIYPCGSERPFISGGQVVITQVDEVDGVEYIRGRLSATLYNLDGPCPRAVLQKPLQAEFRIQSTF
ncbi:hypothetical protein [Fibrella forsythiae]|uniref:ZU5 domain-containing protein n=1 Tax=Fibrella forsythiae TaxID=2817061 RepID=A0ABS3JUK0_9BACT|nr:hypothetical protein [Fibrella forsythiae]MBO0952874.1 hypothetical protein [Fibrella forsythiae]